MFEAVPGLERIIVLDKMVFSLHWLMLWALCGWHIWDIMVDLRNSSMYFLLPARERHKLARSPQPEHRDPGLSHPRLILRLCPQRRTTPVSF